jgi:sugar phosphate isomerase/epimerase
MPGRRLTYCGNVHAADDLDAWLGTVTEHCAPVGAAASAAGREFGLGIWWPVSVAAELAASPAARQRVRSLLLERRLPLWTLNVFPYEGFHAATVKTAVYAPDWTTEARLAYTRDCAEVAATLVAPGTTLPLSTLPLGYRRPDEPPADLRLMARNLARAASAFAAIEGRTGVRCVLALEPEPCCLLETCGQTADFLERWLFDEGAWTTVPAAVLRRHLGVCIDLCHLAVVGEEPLAAFADLRARGIAVPKVQVSSCLELRDGRAIDRLLAFDEPRYLHQTVAASGARALDLGEVRGRRSEFMAGGRVRTHYHMPLFWDEPGAFGSTRAEVERALPALAGAADEPLFEVETYTWSVLGDFAGTRPLAQRLAEELEFAAKLLGC